MKFNQIVKNLSHNKWLLLILLPLVLMVAGFGISYVISQKSITAPGASCQEKYCVSLKNGVASPQSLGVPIGSVVQFNSADNQTHNIILSKDEGGHSGASQVGSAAHDTTSEISSSGDFGAGEAWRTIFSKEGTFSFHDRYNHELTVFVVVFKPGETYKVQ